jgi:hypothetical protein
MPTIYFHGVDGVKFAVHKPTERAAVDTIFNKIKCDSGPLSVRPLNAAALQDALADAFGGEYGILMDV